MIAFADSSALVKRYVDEEGHEPVRALSGVVVSVFARVEVPSALWRKHRKGELPVEGLATALRAFDTDMFDAFIVVSARDTVLEHAARLVGSRQLRAYDAVHLASALAAQAADPACDHFACFDRPLRSAGAIEGLTLVPPTIPGE